MKTPPSHWIKLSDLLWPPGSTHTGATRWIHKLTEMIVLRSRTFMKDGSEWIHLSVSFRDKIPSWNDLTKVKNEFLGEDQEACHMIAKSKDHVNFHSFCMHIWSPVSQVKHLPNLQNIKSEDAV